MMSRDSSPNQPIGGDVNTVGKARINGDVHTSLKVGWLNAQSLTEKTGAVYETIDDNELDVLVLTETCIIRATISHFVWLRPLTS